jgi:hypothetical protein
MSAAFATTGAVPCGHTNQEARTNTLCFEDSHNRLYFTEPTDNHRLCGDEGLQWTRVLPLSWSDDGLYTSS